MDNASSKGPVMADDTIMNQRGHGTCERPVQDNLRWNCDRDLADRICCFNRHMAEHSGYFSLTTFEKEARALPAGETIKFFDSVSGELLFTAPIGRSMDEFLKESRQHGWPSFRDQEVNWEHVRTLKNGEAVSTVGTHLGHNLPDRKGNRYCINLVSVAASGKGASE